MATKTFTHTELSRYFASFSGMDGGNLDAELWICGIEHGSNAEALCGIEPECEPGEWSIEKRISCEAEYRTWSYWRNVAKIVVGTQRAVMAKTGFASNTPDWRAYRDKFLYTRQGWEFKLNLFPLSSPSVSSVQWADAHVLQPALADKEHYRTLCREGGRFDFMRRLRIKHQPKVIVATGVGNRNDFVSAFGFDDCEEKEVIIGRDTAQRRLYVYADHYADERHSVLVVTPFPGCPGGLNSTSLIDELATYVASWMSPADFHTLSVPGME